MLQTKALLKGSNNFEGFQIHTKMECVTKLRLVGVGHCFAWQGYSSIFWEYRRTVGQLALCFSMLYRLLPSASILTN